MANVPPFFSAFTWPVDPKLSVTGVLMFDTIRRCIVFDRYGCHPGVGRRLFSFDCHFRIACTPRAVASKLPYCGLFDVDWDLLSKK